MLWQNNQLGNKRILRKRLLILLYQVAVSQIKCRGGPDVVCEQYIRDFRFNETSLQSATSRCNSISVYRNLFSFICFNLALFMFHDQSIYHRVVLTFKSYIFYPISSPAEMKIINNLRFFSVIQPSVLTYFIWRYLVSITN